MAGRVPWERVMPCLADVISQTGLDLAGAYKNDYT